jgi:tRNA (guanine37-N1)-methyltransferase
MLMNIKDVLRNILSETEIENLRTSFDIIGNVAILEIPEELEKREKIIAEAITKVHKNIKTVCRRMNERKGKFRLRKIKTIIGKETETVHTEFGCKFKLDVKRVYFSPRESTERKRIADLVKDGETILVMFAGIGPYAIIIGKHKKSVKSIYCVELNKSACEYMKENVKLNKLQDKIETICGDVKDKCETFYGKCDRVIMPLPLEGYKYLPIAIKCLKKKGVIHFYHTAREDDLFTEAEKLIREACNKEGKKLRILGRKKVLPYAPRVWKICIDAEVSDK